MGCELLLTGGTTSGRLQLSGLERQSANKRGTSLGGAVGPHLLHLTRGGLTRLGGGRGRGHTCPKNQEGHAAYFTLSEKKAELNVSRKKQALFCLVRKRDDKPRRGGEKDPRDFLIGTGELILLLRLNQYRNTDMTIRTFVGPDIERRSGTQFHWNVET